MNEQQFTKGFNHGYLLAQHEPELATKLTAQSNENDYFKGLTGGKAEFDREALEWAKSFSRGGHEKDSRGMEKER